MSPPCGTAATPSRTLSTQPPWPQHASRQCRPVSAPPPSPLPPGMPLNILSHGWGRDASTKGEWAPPPSPAPVETAAIVFVAHSPTNPAGAPRPCPGVEEGLGGPMSGEGSKQGQNRHHFESRFVPAHDGGCRSSHSLHHPPRSSGSTWSLRPHAPPPPISTCDLRARLRPSL